MPKPNRSDRSLQWGPFAVGAIATAAAAYICWRLIGPAAGHWWHTPTVIVSAVVVFILAASAVSALLSKPTTSKGPTP